MKNQYSFELLIKQELSSDTDKEALFFEMLELTTKGVLVSTIPTFEKLSKVLSDDIFYIAHNLVSYKGKQRTFKGELISCSRKDMLAFLGETIEKDDLRPLLISPKFNNKPKYVVYLTDDNYYFYSSES